MAAIDDTWRTAEEITAQIARLEAYDGTGRNWQRMQTTILAMIDARLNQMSEETIWSRPDTCSRGTYHLHWKKDPLFSDVLDAATRAARNHQNTRAARALAQASERLAIASLPAAGRLVSLLTSADEAIILRAATAILDRAGLETATKTTAANTTVAEWRADAERRRRMAEETLLDDDTAADDGDTDADDPADASFLPDKEAPE